MRSETKRTFLMAGSLSSEEIEDVVSSVRRLVSNERILRAPSRDVRRERLLLTPALRVIPETSPLAPLILDDMVEKPADSPSETAITTGEADPVSTHVGNAVPPAHPEWEDQVLAAPEDVPPGEVVLGTEEGDVLLAPTDDMADSFASAPEDTAEAGSELDADHPQDEPVAFMPSHHSAEDPGADAAMDTISAEPDHAQDDNTAETSAPVEVEGLTASSEPCDFESPPEILDQADEMHQEQHRLTRILDADGTPVDLLDMPTLQAIVREMIREELQGKLGERITSNVRKLVRAEINRALTARDLD